MEAAVSDLIGKVRIAIDEIAKDVDDDFTSDADNEIRQALGCALIQMCGDLPDNRLLPKTLSSETLTQAQVKRTDGTGYLVLPLDYLKLIEFKLESWPISVRDLLDPTSDEAKRQASRWGRGTPQKPCVMESTDNCGNKILRYWTAGKFANNDTGSPKSFYNHGIELFVYVPRPTTSIDGSVMTAPIRDEALQNVIYRASGIFLEGKKENELADRMYALSKQ